MQVILKSRWSGSTRGTDSVKLSPMTDATIQPPKDRSEVRRWSLSAAFVVAAHVGLLAAGTFWFTRHNDFAGTGSQMMTVDLEDAPPNPEPRKFDVAPGPDMQEAPAPAPEIEKQAKVAQEQIPSAPVRQNPDVVAPPEQKEQPKPVTETPVVQKPPQPREPPAPLTTALPAAAQAARASYMGKLSAHLQRYKQYPATARSAGVEGVAILSFTVSQDGQVSGGHIAKSSGSAALDAETLAMLRRAQPLPRFPPEITQRSLTLNAPIRFSLR